MSNDASSNSSYFINATVGFKGVRTSFALTKISPTSIKTEG
jgi:hypothetical protein